MVYNDDSIKFVNTYKANNYLNKNFFKNKLEKEILFLNNFNEKNKPNFLYQKQSNKRNLGIDFARIIAIYLIINHHILYHGGPLFGTKQLTFENNLLIFFNTLFCSGVNIFGIISGFVGYRTHKYSNIIYLLIQTSFYNFGIAYFFKKMKPKTVANLEYFLYPLFITDYWYFNAYFILYFFLPLINMGIQSMDKRGMGIFNLSIFLFFSCFNQIKHYSITLSRDFFNFANGFNYIWLLILYFFGGYFGKYNNVKYKNNEFINILVSFSIILFVTFLRNIIIIYKLKHYNNDNGMKVEYTAPSCVIISISFIIFLSRLNIQATFLQKIISFFSPLTFGVYLIHNHLLVRIYVIKDKYSWLLKYSSFKCILLEFVESLKIFILCSFIDYIRLLLFKIIRIREICIFIQSLLYKIGNRIIFLFEFIIQIN